MIKTNVKKISASFIAFTAILISSCSVQAEEPSKTPQITMGNGKLNAIQTEGLTRETSNTVFSDVRVNEADVMTRRGHATTLTFPEVLIEKAGWIVLHPVINGRPDGDMVSGFAYLNAGLNKGVTLNTDHPAKTGDKFLVMLHSDIDEDRIFDFVFVEDGINVEDTAVFEGTHMIASIITLP